MEKRCSGALFSSLIFFLFPEMNRQLICSVDEELAVPRTIAFVASGVHMNILF